MKECDIIIIGAGPAGLFCGINCAAKGLRVSIVEKNKKPGKKLLLSGSGRCNITHTGDVENFLPHYGGSGRFAKPALMNLSNEDLINFFRTRGLGMKELDGGKIFPVTMKAADVLAVLLRECADRGVEIRYNSSALDITKTGPFFETVTADGNIRSKAVVIAAGGKSYPSTGSSGDGYRLAGALGHKITETHPALAPVIISNYSFAGCSGISIPGAALSIIRDGEKIHGGTGDLLFTHSGLSGPGILDLSRYIRAWDIIRISLVKFSDRNLFEKKLIQEITGSGKKSLKKCIANFDVPERLTERIFHLNNIPMDMKASNTVRTIRKIIVDNLTAIYFPVEKTGDFNEAMATSGGVSLNEINKNTMESKLVPSLYFAGEVIDIDGDSGGYNLQFAFSSGLLAGKSILKKRAVETQGNCE